MIWKPNETIQGGKYLIKKVLGIGGFGITYHAIDTETDGSVAIKTANDLIQTRANFSEQQDKFVREAFRLAKCQHHNIVEVKDVCREESLWCMVMEYLHDGTLEEYTFQNKVLSEAETLPLIQQIGSALTYIHQQGLLHRDVKPSNIMLRKDNAQAILIDFGLAREFIDGKTQTHTNARTESYAPIEQYQIRAKRGACTDVYALAATCYFLLTGVPPLPAQFRWQGAKLIPPKNHNPYLSDRLNRGIIRGMILEPEKRPQSIAEWLDIIAIAKTQRPDPKYARLTQLLSDREWDKADEETYDLILKVSNRVREGWLEYSSTKTLACEVLQTIDLLWLSHSNGRFGFSVQRKIWQELGGKIDYNTECLLGERLGWRVAQNWLDRKNLNFSLNAPQGHFPWNGHLPEGKLKEIGLVGSYARWWSCLILSRCGQCNI